jgi:amino acid transporter
MPIWVITFNVEHGSCHAILSTDTIELPSGCTEDEARNARLNRTQELFYLCYHCVDNLIPRPQIFNAQYGLFRCLFGLFGLLCALSILGILATLASNCHTALLFLSLAVLFGVCCWLSYERCKKRSEDFAQSVYDLFLARLVTKPGGEP